MPFHTARRTARRAALGTLAAQAVTVAGLMAFDSLRKRDRPEYKFPRTTPRTLSLGDGDMRVYTYGEDLYRDMLADIDGASERIFFETFIWKGDRVGQEFKDALVRAHQRGVEVYIAFDQFANLVVRRAFYADLPPGIHVKRHPIVSGGWKFLHPRHSGRNHRKLLVIDDRAAYVGGYNIGTLYATRWRDTHARFTGDMVVELVNAFVDYWNIRVPRGQARLTQPAPRTWSRNVWVHRNTPVDLVFPIRNMYLEAMDRAEERIYLTQAYLIPDDAIVRVLLDAVRRGVDVRIIVPRYSNHVVADWLSRSRYERLLRGGVRLFRYEGAMVHAKTGTIDGRWSTVGTANIDRLSLAGNFELNLEILDPEVAAHMETIFSVDSGNCTELTLAEWLERPLIARVTEGLLSPWRPLL